MGAGRELPGLWVVTEIPLHAQGGLAPGVFLLLSEPWLCRMGLSSSKAQPRVTRVAPVPGQGDCAHPGALAALQGLPREPGQPWGKPIFHLELPPLRETRHGGASAGEGSLLGRGDLGSLGWGFAGCTLGWVQGCAVLHQQQLSASFAISRMF